MFWSLKNGIITRMQPFDQNDPDIDIKDLSVTIEIKGKNYRIKDFQASRDMCPINTVSSAKIYRTFNGKLLLFDLILNKNTEESVSAPEWRRIFIFTLYNQELIEIWSGRLTAKFKCFISQQHIHMAIFYDPTLRPTYKLWQMHDSGMEVKSEGLWSNLYMYPYNSKYLDYVFKLGFDNLTMYLIDNVLVINHELYLDFINQEARCFENRDYHCLLDNLVKRKDNYISTIPTDIVTLIKTWIPTIDKEYMIQPIVHSRGIVNTSSATPKFKWF